MSKANHPIEQEELMAYLDGELPVDRAGAAAGHLEHCRECQGLAADLQSVSRRLMEWQVEPVVPEITPNLLSALGQSRQRSRPRARRWLFGLTAAALATLAFMAVFPTNYSKHAAPPPPSLVRRAGGSNATYFSSAEPMIARVWRLNVTTNQFDQSRAGLENIAKRHSGYFGQLNVYAPAGISRVLIATLRIPATQRDAAVAEIKKLGRVDSESQTGEEVTSEYLDLEARLANARNTERRLTDVLRQRTGKLADVLDVEKEISRVRGEIERMEVQKKDLTTRVDFLTLEVTLTEERPVQSHNSFVDAAAAGYRRVIDGATSIALFLLAYGPSLLICLAILFFPVRWAWKRFRRT